MMIVSNIVIGIVAILHIGFLILEMFLWTRPFGMKTFGMTKEVAQSSAVLAANQGLYNGFLAAGLIWGARVGIDFRKNIFPCLCANRWSLWWLNGQAIHSIYSSFTCLDRFDFSFYHTIKGKTFSDLKAD